MLEEFSNCVIYYLNDETFPKKPEIVVFTDTSIKGQAFQGCNSLTSIVIGSSVTSIGAFAFDMCENLTFITFQGTIAQWKKIELRFGWNNKVPAKVVHCTDGDVEL